MKNTVFLPVLLYCGLIHAQPNITASQCPPTNLQLAWHDQEFYLFAHFGPNTFTDREWGYGDEPAAVFNPTRLDCRQWVRIAKTAGAKGIIITAKHHDGFCLWPSNYSKHTVRESKWKNGKGDVLSDLSRACKEAGLKFGVYISPWDRNHPDYGTDKYNDVFVNMIKEIFSNYGPIWEMWWDGANGEGPSGKRQVYDWRKFEQTVREISPSTLIFSDIGPDIRWAGNERGVAGETNWNYLDTAGFDRGSGAPHTDTLNQGNVNGRFWIPAECDVSIRPGWFHHLSEDDKVKTAEQLFDLYLKSVGRGTNMLLNVPPDRRGLINENDSIALIRFKELREQNFKTNIALEGKGYFVMQHGTRPSPFLNDNKDETNEIILINYLNSAGIEFRESQWINCITLREDMRKGQNCKNFRVILMDKNHRVLKEITGSTIGRKRILVFEKTEAAIIELVIEDQKGPVSIIEIEAYLLNEKLLGVTNRKN